MGKRWRLRTTSLGLAVVLALCVGAALAGSPQPGEIGPSLGLTANGRALHPVGRLTTVGNFPTGSALTPGGRFLWVTDCGHGYNDVQVVNVATGKVIQTLPLPGCYGGIAMAPDAKTAYVSGNPKGSAPTEGPTLGDQGDVVHIFSVDAATGRGTERPPLVLAATTGGSGRTNSLPPVSGVGTAYPQGLAVSPDGKSLVVALNTADKAMVVNLGTGSQTAVDVGRYPNDVVFDRHGRAYVSNEYDGTVSVIDPSTGKVVATVAGLGGALGDLASHPEGMVADPVRDQVYVAVANRDLVAMLDTRTERVSARISVGRPQGLGTSPVKLSVTPDGRTLYAADANEDALVAISLVKRPARAPKRIYEPPSVRQIGRYRAGQHAAARRLAGAHGHARAAALRRYRATLRSLSRRYLAFHTLNSCAGPTRRQAQRYVAAVLSALGAHGRVRRRRLARARGGLVKLVRCTMPAGYLPGLQANRVIGRLPTDAYPDSVQVTPNGGALIWIAGKGLGAGPNPNYFFAGVKTPYQPPSSTYGTYVLDMLLGRVGVLPLPTDRQIQAETAAANAQVVPANAEAQPAGSPIPAPSQGPSKQIKHVFYIVRENRAYDQVFGSDPRGDGDAKLELFDTNGVVGATGGVTPNAHALAHQFPLLDHYYMDSEVSVDGHLITAGGFATDYVQKSTAANYSGRRGTFDYGLYPVTFPPRFFIFDQAAAQGISFRDFGEQSSGNLPLGNAPNRPDWSKVAANTDLGYPNNLFIGCLRPGVVATCTQDSGLYKITGKLVAGQSRFDHWYPEFQQEVAAGTVPTLTYMILPNDHTNGTTTGDFTPQAMIADNDLALGQIIDAISHSSIWSQSAIFVEEDDSQDGADHVDAHRSPALIISPWARHGAVVHTRLDQYSMLRTIELIAGIDPLSLNDALATPMYDAFVSRGATPDTTPYNVVSPTQDIGQMNTGTSPAAKTSNALPWNHLDAVPQVTSDQILWAAVHGSASPPPPPGPNASAPELELAKLVAGMLRDHKDVTQFLLGGGDG